MSLSSEERTALLQVLAQPAGWEAIQKLAVEAVAEFRECIFKLNPQAPGYDQQVLKLVMRAECAQTVWEEMARRIEAIQQEATTPRPKGTKPTLADAIEDVTEGL